MSKTSLFDDLEVPVADQSTHHAGPDSDPIDSLADNHTTSRFNTSTTAIYSEPCPKCRGTGTFYSYSGRPLGQCFKCKGTGTIKFKTDSATRQRARTSAASRKEAKAQAFRDSPIGVFLEANQWSTFAASLYQAGQKYGELTDKQLTAATSMQTKVEARQAERQAQQANQPTGTIDLSDIPAGRYADPDSDTRLKVLIQKPSNGKWKGWIFVSDAAEYGQRTKYGRQAPGKLYTGKIEDTLTTIAADPHAASVAYGKLTSTCGICNRPLEDEKSVAAGIGPICAKRFS